MEGLEVADLVKIAAGSGVVAAVVSSGIGWIKDRLVHVERRRLEAEIEAINLISKLDALAAQCARNFWAFHKRWGEMMDGQHGGKIASCAKPALIIDPASLAKIDRSLACRIAWIENDIQLGSNGIQARWEVYRDPEDAVAADADLVGYFGYEALMISRALRTKYKLNHKGAQWGMERIEQQLKQCSENTEKFLKDQN